MILQFIFSFVCSVIFAILLTFIFKRRGPGPFDGMLYFFGIIFSFTLAMGVWMRPFGPTFNGLPWVAVIATALLITLLIAEFIPHKDKGRYVKSKKELEEEAEKDEEILEKEFSILIGIIILILLGAFIYALTHRLPALTRGF